MMKHLIIMAIILAALIAWERSLSSRAETSRIESALIARFIDREAIFGEGSKPIAAIRVRIGDAAFLYVQHEGMWRCVQAHGAPALPSHIDAIITKLLAAEGVVHTTRADDAASYGIGTNETIRLELCGPDVLDDPEGEVILAIDIGRPIATTGGSYLRQAMPTSAQGDNAIWAVNVDLHEELATETPGIPPMLDPHIVPESWPGWRRGIARITIERADAIENGAVIAERRERELSDEERAIGVPPWEWVIATSSGQRRGSITQLWSFTTFLARAPYAGILAPRPPEEVGLDQPRALITMESADGHTAQLAIGGRGPQGGAVVYSSFARTVFEVDSAVAEALVPSAEMLTGEVDLDPWDRLLRR